MRSKNANDQMLCDNCGRELNDYKRLLCADCFAYIRKFGQLPDDETTPGQPVTDANANGPVLN